MADGVAPRLRMRTAPAIEGNGIVFRYGKQGSTSHTAQIRRWLARRRENKSHKSLQTAVIKVAQEKHDTVRILK